jgi:hypothetical protein
LIVSVVSLIIGTIIIETFKPEIMQFKEDLRRLSGIEDRFNVVNKPEVAEK